MGFTLGQSVYGIGHQPAGVADLGMDGGAGGTKAQGHVARVIHRYAAHPAPGCVWLVGAFLKDCFRAGRHVAQLEPANTCHPSRAYGKIPYYRFVIAKIPISHPEHRTVGKAVDVSFRG